MNHYETLEVREDASQEVIRAAYKILAQKYHPDKNKDSTAQEKMQAVNVAYSTLSDASKKEKYDFELKNNTVNNEESEKNINGINVVNENGKGDNLIINEDGISLTKNKITSKDFISFSMNLNHQNDTVDFKITGINGNILFNSKDNYSGDNTFKILEKLEEYYKSKMILWFIKNISDSAGFNYHNLIEFNSTGIYLIDNIQFSNNKNNLFIKYEDVRISKLSNKIIIFSSKNDEKVSIYFNSDILNWIAIEEVIKFAKNNSPISKTQSNYEKDYYNQIKKIEKEKQQIELEEKKSQEKKEALEKKNQEIEIKKQEDILTQQNSHPYFIYKKPSKTKFSFIMLTYLVIAFFATDFVFNYSNLNIRSYLTISTSSKQKTTEFIKKQIAEETFEELVTKFDKAQSNGNYEQDKIYEGMLNFANKKNKKAYNYLGLMRLNGWGTTKDISEAVLWFNLSSENNNTFADAQLGAIYMLGLGGLKNDNLAIKYLYKAYKNGDIGSANNLGIMYSEGRGVPKNLGHALGFFEYGISKNNTESMVNASFIYKESDYKKYIELLKKASKLGNKFATEQLSTISKP